jgi:hypothetical protein
MPIRHALLLLVAVTACTGNTAPPAPVEVPIAQVDPRPGEAQTEQAEGGAYCEHRRFACWPWQGDLQCTAACGYTSQCVWYTDYEMSWCARHPGQYLPGHGQCTKGGDCWWNTYCINWNISLVPRGTESTSFDPSQATPPEAPGILELLDPVDPNEPSTAAYPDATLIDSPIRAR